MFGASPIQHSSPMFSGDMPFSANSDAENLFRTEESVPSISQNLEVKKEESSSIPDFTTIDRCKKLQTLLNAGPLKDEALTLQNILATQFSNWAAFQLTVKGGDKFFVALSRSLPNYSNLENLKAVAETRRVLAKYIYGLKEYAEVFVLFFSSLTYVIL